MVHLLLDAGCLLLKLIQHRLRPAFAHGRLETGSCLVELRAPETQLPLQVLLTEPGRVEKGLQSGQEGVTDRGIRFGSQRGVRRVQSRAIQGRSLAPCRIVSDFLDESIDERPLRRRCLGLCQRLAEFPLPDRKFRAVLLPAACLGQPRLHLVAKGPLVDLPLAAMVRRHHPHRGRQQPERRDGEHHVQPLQVVEGRVRGRHEGRVRGSGFRNGG